MSVRAFVRRSLGRRVVVWRGGNRVVFGGAVPVKGDGEVRADCRPGRTRLRLPASRRRANCTSIASGERAREVLITASEGGHADRGRRGVDWSALPAEAR